MAGLAFLTALAVFIAAVFDLGMLVAKSRSMPPTPTLEAAIVKVAWYIPPATAEPIVFLKPTATAPPTSTPKATGTSTRTITPTRRPTLNPTPSATQRTPGRMAVNAIPPTTTMTPTPSQISLNESYGLLQVIGRPDDRQVAGHADLNLNLRGFAPVSATLGLIDYDGDTDYGAPQLAGLLPGISAPVFASAFQVYGWNWTCDCRGPLIDDPAVTLVSIQSKPGDLVRVPRAGAQIGNGFAALVIYADSDQITLKYTRSDSAADGYVLHLQAVAIDPDLLALYRQADIRGRGELPAMWGGQSFGRAKGNGLKIAIRDAGTFLDPRSRKDWWHDY